MRVVMRRRWECWYVGVFADGGVGCVCVVTIV
jgi:hypothetical protein